MAAGINMAKMIRMAPALLVLFATLNIVVVSSTRTTDHEIYNKIESTTITTVITEAAAARRRRRRSSIECLCSPRSYVFRIPKFLSLPSGDHSCDAPSNNNNTIHKSKEGISDSLCINFPPGNVNTTTIETTSLSFFEFSTSLNSTIIHQLSSSFDDDDDDDEMDYHLVEFPSASQNIDPSLPLEEQSERNVPGGVMLLLTGRMGGSGSEGVTTRDVNVQSTIAWNYDGRECRVEPMGMGDSIGWLIVEEYEPAISEFCPATATTVTEMEDEDDDAHKIFYSKSSKAGKGHGGKTVGGSGNGGKSKSGKGNAINNLGKSGKSGANNSSNSNSNNSGKTNDKTHSGKSKSGKSGSSHDSGVSGKSGKSGR